MIDSFLCCYLIDCGFEGVEGSNPPFSETLTVFVFTTVFKREAGPRQATRDLVGPAVHTHPALLVGY